MSGQTLTRIWDVLWEKHEETKGLFYFFAKPTDALKGKKKEKEETAAAQDPNEPEKRSYKKSQWIGLILGPLLFIATLLFFQPEGLSFAGRAVLAGTLWIACWWVTEAIPIPATSLLPLVLFPITQGLDMDKTASSYGDETIFLFMGGFMIAMAMEKWGLHKRIALSIIAIIGTNTQTIVLGFMVATGFLSMWISNSATAMMMVPIGLAIIYQVTESLKDEPSIDTRPENFAFGKALMLGIAYSASVGGISTLIGTPPNAIFASVAHKLFGVDISFAKWMLFGVPIAWVFLLLSWIYLVKVAFPLKIKKLPGGREVIQKEKRALGKASGDEIAVLIVFICAALAWITRSFWPDLFGDWAENVEDGMIAMAAAVTLFVIPSFSKKGDRVLDWNTAVKLPWGVLLLFGGGLAIASGFQDSGLAKWMGQQLTVFEGVGLYIILLLIVTLVIFLTEITSNTATATMMFPIMATLAVSIGIHPYAAMIAAGVAASCAFMLPVATPPNAVVFGSGYLRIIDMIKAGFALNILGMILIPIAIYFLLPAFWGIDLTHVPDAFR